MCIRNFVLNFAQTIKKINRISKIQYKTTTIFSTIYLRQFICYSHQENQNYKQVHYSSLRDNFTSQMQEN